jgi:hypothetical protein
VTGDAKGEWMSKEKKCPECFSDIDKDAVVCKFCGKRIVGIKCKNCATICKPEAKSCRWCGAVLTQKNKVNLAYDFEIKASLFGTLLYKRSLFPQRIIFLGDKIIIRSYSSLMMTKKDKTISWDKISGFDHKKGFFWDTITISNYGQRPIIIECIRPSDVKVMKRVIQ